MNKARITVMHASPGEHPSDDTLELYSMSRLAGAELDIVEEHLFACGSCRERVKEADEYVTSMRQALLEMQTSPDSTPGESSRSWLATLLDMPKPLWAAPVVAVALLVVLMPGLRSPVDPRPVSLEAWRGEASTINAVVPAGEPLAITADATGLPGTGDWVVQVVDAGGVEIASMGAIREGNRVVVGLESGLATGQYWVRIHRSEGGARRELLREFGLRVE